jgi:thiol-disulfide isomerase/thioredoxin
MKQSVFFLLLLFSFNTYSQNHGTEPLTLTDPGMDGYLQVKHPATLTIRIIHAPDTISSVWAKCTFVHFGSSLQTSKFYQFDKNGTLQIELKDRLPYQQIWLTIDHYLYAGLYVNNGLELIIDAEKLKNRDRIYMIDDGVQFSGVDGELNTAMNKRSVYKKDVRITLESRLYELATTRRQYGDIGFMSKYDSVFQAIYAINEEFARNYPDFKWAIQNQLMAEYLGYLCVAYWGDKMPDSLFKKIDFFAPYFSSNEGVLFYNYFFHYLISKSDNPKIDIDNHLYNNYFKYSSEQRTVLDSLKYYSQLPELERKNAAKEINKRKQALFLGEIAKINAAYLLHLMDSLYTGPKSDLLKIFVLDKGKIEFATTYPEIIKSIQTNWCRRIAITELEQARVKQKNVDSLLARGTLLKDNNSFIGQPLDSLPFNARLYRLDSIKSVDEFIINLKSKFSGQALVIDFWATWCVPCISDMPASKKLQESNKDLPITFIYVCTNSGSNVNVWKNKIADLQIPGIHIFADDKIVSELQSKFNAEKGFPAYVVIDANGKIKPKAIERIRLLDRSKLKNAVGL